MTGKRLCIVRVIYTSGLTIQKQPFSVFLKDCFSALAPDRICLFTDFFNFFNSDGINPGVFLYELGVEKTQR